MENINIWGRLGCTFSFTPGEKQLIDNYALETALMLALREGRAMADGDVYLTNDDGEAYQIGSDHCAEGSLGLPCIMSVPRRPNCMVRKDLMAKGDSIPTEAGGFIAVGVFWGEQPDEDNDKEFNVILKDAYGNFIARVNSIDLDWIG